MQMTWSLTWEMTLRVTWKMTRKVNRKRTLKVQYLEDSVLHHAVDNDDVEKCRDLLSKGYDPNIVDYIIDDSDYTPLMKAAEKGNMEICQLLCDKGADLSCVDRFGRTAPTIAAEEGHLQSVSSMPKH